MKRAVLLALGLCFVLAACTVEDTVPVALTDRDRAALAVKKPYLSVISQMDASGRIAAPETAGVAAPSSGIFGPVIGRYFLGDDYVVYRHARQEAPVPLAAVTAGDTSLGPIDRAQPLKLTYFLVAPEGIVTDYATGVIAAEAQGCIRVDAGAASVCTSQAELSRALGLLDAVMRTSAGNPVSAWDVNAPATIEATP